MKIFCICLVIGIISTAVSAQDTLMLRVLNEWDEEMLNDQQAELLEEWLSKPVSLLKATAAELMQTGLFSYHQVKSLLEFRTMMGGIPDIQALAAIPYWDHIFVAKIRPYVSLSELEWSGSLPVSGKARVHVLGRTRQTFTRTASEQWEKNNNNFTGNAWRYYIKGRFQPTDQLHFGWCIEKDEGERWWNKAYVQRVDHLAGYLEWTSKSQKIKTILGTYTVQFGQGLVLWQGAGLFTDITTNSKKQSQYLLPYAQAGEWNYSKGIAQEIILKKWTIHLFLNYRKLDARIESVNDQQIVRSFQMSGYHRTPLEISRRNILPYHSKGVAITKSHKNWSFQYHMVHHQWAHTIIPDFAFYRIPQLSGVNFLWNQSCSFEGQYRNLHFFGELAADHRGKIALVKGLMAGINQQLGIQLHYAKVSEGYWSFGSGAFLQQSAVSNEESIYYSLHYRQKHLELAHQFRLSFFPWWRYGVRQSSYRVQQKIQCLIKPSKIHSITLHWQMGIESFNEVMHENENAHADPISRPQKVRMHLQHNISEQVELQHRYEWVMRSGQEEFSTSFGYLYYWQLKYKLRIFKLQFLLRSQVFDIPDYEMRIYTYENDGFWASRFPFFYGRGVYRYVAISGKFQLKSRSAWFHQIGISAKAGRLQEVDQLLSKSLQYFVQMIIE